MIVLTIWGKLPPTGANAWIGFFASITFLILLLVALPMITKREAKRAGGAA